MPSIKFSDVGRTFRLLPRAFWIAIYSNRAAMFMSWVVIPVVVLAMLVFVWAVNFALMGKFPASVCAMIIAFLALLLSSFTLGRHKTAIPLRYLEPTSDFLLKWISIFFCPSFILLPLEEANTGMGGIEIVKIIALFLGSFVVFVVLAWAVVVVLQFISPFKVYDDRVEDDELDDDVRRHPPEADAMSVADLSSPTNNHGRAEEAGLSTSIELEPIDGVPARPEPAAIRDHLYQNMDTDTGPRSGTISPFEMDSTVPSTPAYLSRIGSQATLVQQALAPKDDADAVDPAAALARRLATYIPTFIYGIIFLISIPIFYTTSQSLPLFLSYNILCYLFAVLAIPPRIRQFLHPILTCSFLSIMGIWGMGAIKGWSLDESLDHYSTNSRYLVLFNPNKTAPVPPPGAGDVLYSVLDASIVSLAIPMYRYRSELRRHAFEMFSTTIPLAVLSLFIYPLISRAIQIAPSRALAFAARSVTTPLAIPMEATLKGDPGLTVVLCILTGVLGAICGPQLLRLLRVKDSDFITIGIVLGCTASAISTAALLSTNPRAAAISSLAFVLYGIACIVLASIPPVADIVQTLAGL